MARIRLKMPARVKYERFACGVPALTAGRMLTKVLTTSKAIKTTAACSILVDFIVVKFKRLPRAAYGTRSPREATHSAYQSSRDSLISDAPAASRICAGSLEPTSGIMPDGCASSHARASCVGVALS